MRKILLTCLLIAVCSIALAGCGSPNPNTVPVATQSPNLAQPSPLPANPELQSTPTVQPAYPPPGEAYPAPGDSYPAPGESYPAPLESYPAPPAQPTTPVEVVRFRINKPVPEGAKEVSGVGPPGVPIVIADVNFMGEVLGESIIGSDGAFVVKLNKPLEKNHRIGVALGDLSGTSWDASNFDDPGFMGDEARQVPTVGFFYDTAAVGGG